MEGKDVVVSDVKELDSPDVCTHSFVLALVLLPDMGFRYPH